MSGIEQQPPQQQQQQQQRRRRSRSRRKRFGFFNLFGFTAEDATGAGATTFQDSNGNHSIHRRPATASSTRTNETSEHNSGGECGQENNSGCSYSNSNSNSNSNSQSPRRSTDNDAMRHPDAVAAAAALSTMDQNAISRSSAVAATPSQLLQLNNSHHQAVGMTTETRAAVPQPINIHRHGSTNQMPPLVSTSSQQKPRYRRHGRFRSIGGGDSGLGGGSVSVSEEWAGPLSASITENEISDGHFSHQLPDCGGIPSSSPFSALRQQGQLIQHRGPQQQIRTCPIPERLRLQLRDNSIHDSTDSGSPTITAASYSGRNSADSPRIMAATTTTTTTTTTTSPEGKSSSGVRAHRRDTIGSFSSESRSHVHGTDKPTTALLATYGSVGRPWRADKALPPIARRTDSNHSSWSISTPVTAIGTIATTTEPVTGCLSSNGDYTEAGATGNGSQYGVLPSWEPCTGGQTASAKSRNRSRRYSVFDISFASQRPIPALSQQDTIGLADQCIISQKRRSSNKSTAEPIDSYDPWALEPNSTGMRTRGTNIVRPHQQQQQQLHISPSFGARERASPFTSTASLAADFSLYRDSPPPPPPHRHYRHRSQHSATTFSMHSSLADDLRHESDYENDSTAGSPNSRRRRNRLLPIEHQHHHQRASSSSGYSSPNQMLFSKIRRRTSSSAKSISLADIHDNSKLVSPRHRRKPSRNGNSAVGASVSLVSASGATAMSASLQSTRTPLHRCGDSHRDMHSNRMAPPLPLPSSIKHDWLHDNDDNNVDEKVNKAQRFGTEREGHDDDGDDLQYLNLSTSIPTTLDLPMVSHLEGHLSTIDRPNYSYEIFIALMRSAKVRRWGSQSRQWSETSPVIPLSRQDTASTSCSHTLGGTSRKGSAQQPPDYLGMYTANDPADSICWVDWIDSIKVPPSSPVAQRAIAIWKRILNSWRQHHRPRYNPLPTNRKDSSASNIGMANMGKAAPAIFQTNSLQSTTSNMDIGTIAGNSCISSANMPSSIMNPCLIEPSYLQRGVSETGRPSLTSFAFTTMYQLPIYEPSLESSTAFGAGASISADASMVDPVGMSPPQMLPQTTANEIPYCLASSPDGDSASQLLPAPHRRLSIIKNQELGSKFRSIGGSSGVTQLHISNPTKVGSDSGASFLTNTNSSTHSLGSNIATKNASNNSGSGQMLASADSNANEKGHWMIGKLENPEEAVKLLLTTQMRIHARLSKAKSESENELVDIIQNLGEFVEEGLSYVNEDQLGSEEFSYDGEYNDPDQLVGYKEYADHQDSGSPSVSDVSNMQTPGLEISCKTLEAEYARATALKDEEGKSNTSTSTSSRGLDILGKQIRGVLGKHGILANAGTKSNASPQTSDDGSGNSRGDIDSHTSAIAAVIRKAPIQRLIRSPSIRRLAFLRAFSGESSNTDDDDSANGGDRSRQGTLSPSGGSDSKGDVEQDVAMRSSSAATATTSGSSCKKGTNPPVISVQSQMEKRTPSSASPISKSIDASSGNGDYMPFPSLRPKESMQSISSTSRISSAGVSNSSETGSRSDSRCSQRRGRSSSRMSVYSNGSGTSMLTSPLIAEDEFKPTLFLQAIVELVNVIGHVISLPPEEMMLPMSGSLLEEAVDHFHLQNSIDQGPMYGRDDEGGSGDLHRLTTMMPTAYIMQRLNELGSLWEQKPNIGLDDMEKQDFQQPWPCRGLFVRALLAISSLNRIVMWYSAVRSTYSEDIVAELDKRSKLLGTNNSSNSSSSVLHPIGISPPQTPDATTVSSQLGSNSMLPQLARPADKELGNGGKSSQVDFQQHPSVTSLAALSVVSSQPSQLRMQLQQQPLDSYSMDSDTAGTRSGSGNDSMMSENKEIQGARAAYDTAAAEWHNYHIDHPPRWQVDSNHTNTTAMSQDAAVFDKGLNMLMEISLDGRIRYISPTCQRLLGVDPDVLIDQPASVVFGDEDLQTCRSAVEQLLTDSSQTVEVNLIAHSPYAPISVSVEAKGMLIYNRRRNDEPSHVMWVLRYVSSIPVHTSAITDAVVTDVEAGHNPDREASALEINGTELPDVMEEDEECEEREPAAVAAAAVATEMAMEDITCRICDRGVPAAYFEEHTWLCAQSHRAAMDVQLQNDRLNDIKSQIQMWYPGCGMEELEKLLHGEIDADTIRDQVAKMSTEVGEPAWQNLMDEAGPITKSMVKICAQAISLNDSDVIPKCDMPASKIGSNAAGSLEREETDVDFIRSSNWTDVADYSIPQLTYKDASLENLGDALLQAISAKLAAMDNLQYAIVESSVSCSKWVVAAPSEQSCTNISRDESLSANTTTALSSQLNVPSRGETSLSDASSRTGDDYSGNASETPGLVMATSSSHRDTEEPLGLKTKLTSDNKQGRSCISATEKQKPSPVLRVSTTNIHPTPSRVSGRTTVAGGGGSSSSNAAGDNTSLATPTMPSIHDFALLKPISKGAYGSVFLAKKRTTGEYYAIKILKKRDMISKNQINNVKAERAIMMAQTGSPFVVRLLYTFQTRTSLYLVMEYLNGGDCAALLKVIGELPEDWTRHYLAEVVLGIEDLHSRDVVHRDLKPDNLLIDSEGHLKLTDFGLSKLGFLGRRVDQQTMQHPLPMDRIAIQDGGTSSQHQQQPQQQQAGIISSSYVWRPYVGDSPKTLSPIEGYHLHQHRSLEHRNSRGATSPLSGSPNAVTEKRIATLKSSPRSMSVSSSAADLKNVATSSAGSSVRTGGSSAGASFSSGSGAGISPILSNNSVREQLPNRALGTPDYIAPESILGLESGRSVDWWALGIICYEFLFGIPPFHDETPEKVFSNILSGDVDFFDDMREQLLKEREENKRQRHLAGDCEDDDDDEDSDLGIVEISPEFRDFILRLLNRDPKKRLGYNGAEEVKAHPVFRGINWNTLLDTQPAFVPQVENAEDTNYFDQRGASMEDSSPTPKPKTTTAANQPQQQDKSVSAAIDTQKKAEDSMSMTKSHTHAMPPSPLNIVSGHGIAIHRPKTVPVRLEEGNMSSSDGDGDNLGIRDGSENDDGSGLSSLLDQSHTRRGGTGSSNRRSSHSDDDMPALEEDAEFGGFTFKNLHALEQANMDELVKLRRRSTLMDVTSRVPLASSSREAKRQSFAPGMLSMKSIDNVLPDVKRHHSLIGHKFRDNAQRVSSSDRNSRAQLEQQGISIPASEDSNWPYLFPSPLPSQTLDYSTPPPHATFRVSQFSAPGRMRSKQRGAINNLNTSQQPPPPPDFRHAATDNILADVASQAQQNELSPQYMESRICLVADDNPVSLKIMEIVLRRMNLECVSVRNGAEAIRCAMGRTVFRAIFMDLGMPIVDGDEAARMIKSTYNSNKETPIVAMAAYADEATEMLYDDAVVKPVTVDNVKRCLERNHFLVGK